MQELRRSFLKEHQHVDYSHVTLDRIQWSALANTVTKHQDPQTARELLTSCVSISSSRASAVYEVFFQHGFSVFDIQQPLFKMQLLSTYFLNVFMNQTCKTKYLVHSTLYSVSLVFLLALLLASCISVKCLHHLCLHGISISQQSNYIIDLMFLTQVLP